MIYFISHRVYLRNTKSLLAEGFNKTVEIFLIDLDNGVGVLDGDTHLEKVL